MAVGNSKERPTTTVPSFAVFVLKLKHMELLLVVVKTWFRLTRPHGRWGMPAMACSWRILRVWHVAGLDDL